MKSPKQSNSNATKCSVKRGDAMTPNNEHWAEFQRRLRILNENMAREIDGADQGVIVLFETHIEPSLTPLEMIKELREMVTLFGMDAVSLRKHLNELRDPPIGGGAN